jgi:transcription elongation factor GreA
VTAFVNGLSPEVRAGLHDDGVLLPWANLEAVTGERKKTGITGSLLEADADAPTGKAGAASSSKRPARATAGTRSSPSGAGRARVTSSGGSSGRSGGSGRTASSKPLPPPTHITAAGLASLNAELTELTRIERPAVIARVKHARELGDLRENADYEAARNEQSFLEGRIQSLEQLIKTAEVIGTDHTGEVMIGSTVRIEADGDEQTFRIVGSTEANPAAGRISNVSPVGKALVGRRAGDEVTIELPGSKQTYRIVEVR